MKLFSALHTQYTAFIEQVSSYLSKTLSKANLTFGSNTIFGQIVSVVGSALQNIMLYIEDALVEQNKYTAQRTSSLWGLATLSGYMPSFGKAAIASLKLSYIPNNTDGYNILLEDKTTLVCTQNGLKYNIILPQETIVLNPVKDNSEKYFSAVQGIFKEQEFISTGGQYYTINLKFSGNLDTDFLTVKVNNEIWQYAASLYDMTPDAKQYTFKAGMNGGIDLIFGNIEHGRPLYADDVVTVKYLIHDGENGNLDPNVETYFVFDKMMIDTDGDEHDGNSLFNITFAEYDAVVSGSNAENLNFMREMIGFNSRSLVLAGPENYKVLINRFGFCGYNKTWVDAHAMIVNSLIMKNYKTNLQTGKDYFSLTENDFKLTDFQKQTVLSYIENSGSQLAATKYNIVDPELCKYAMYVYVSPKSPKYNKETLETKIIQCIGAFFATNQPNDKFIPKSDIIHAIKNNVEGVDGVDVYIISEENEHAIISGKYTNTYYELNNTTGQYIKKTETVKIYDGENPNLGLDIHGNIYMKHEFQFPVLMGGWYCLNADGESVLIDNPVTIIFED